MNVEEIKYLKTGWQQKLFIISAGPSVKHLNLRGMKNEAIMTVNNAILHMPENLHINYHVYCEPVYAEKENYAKMSQVVCDRRFSLHDYPGWIKVPGNIQDFAFILAIKLADILDYREVILAGYDFGADDDNYVYWWDDKPRDEEEIKKKEWILNKQRTIFIKFIKKYNIRINSKNYKDNLKVNILDKKGDIISIGDYLSG